MNKKITQKEIYNEGLMFGKLIAYKEMSEGLQEKTKKEEKKFLSCFRPDIYTMFKISKIILDEWEKEIQKYKKFNK